MATFNQLYRKLDRVTAKLQTIDQRTREAEQCLSTEEAGVYFSRAMIQGRELANMFSEAMQDLIELAAENSPLTQTAMEQALGVPKGTLRGLRRRRVI